MQTAFLELSPDLTIREVWRASPSERFRRKNTGKSARATFRSKLKLILYATCQSPCRQFAESRSCFGCGAADIR